MEFDIYGGNLRSGHCEVHPHVHEEFPCSICCSESSKKKSDSQKYQEYCEAQAKDYYIIFFENIDGAGI